MDTKYLMIWLSLPIVALGFTLPRIEDLPLKTFLVGMQLGLLLAQLFIFVFQVRGWGRIRHVKRRKPRF